MNDSRKVHRRRLTLLSPKIFFRFPRVYCNFCDFLNFKFTTLRFLKWEILGIFEPQKMTIGSFWKMKWQKRWSRFYLSGFLRGLFLKKSHKFRKSLILGGDLGMLFLHKKRSKSFILSIYTLLEFTMFEKMLLFFVLILKWYVYMVFLKWCVYMVFFV